MYMPTVQYHHNVDVTTKYDCLDSVAYSQVANYHCFQMPSTALFFVEVLLRQLCFIDYLSIVFSINAKVLLPCLHSNIDRHLVFHKLVV